MICYEKTFKNLNENEENRLKIHDFKIYQNSFFNQSKSKTKSNQQIKLGKV